MQKGMLYCWVVLEDQIMRMNEDALVMIPQCIVTNKVLEDFLLAVRFGFKHRYGGLYFASDGY
jgi:hypothetical protein